MKLSTPFFQTDLARPILGRFQQTDSQNVAMNVLDRNIWLTSSYNEIPISQKSCPTGPPADAVLINSCRYGVWQKGASWQIVPICSQESGVAERSVIASQREAADRS